MLAVYLYKYCQSVPLMLKLSLLLNFWVTLHFTCYAISTSLEVETKALLDIKSHITDPLNLLESWTDKSGSPCNFFGIKCDNNTGRVAAISLTNCSLSGNLSPYISVLENLSSLELGSNSISGAIPAELANCTNLKVLNLSNNAFTGEIPDLSALDELQVFDLSTNELQGNFPNWLGRLPNLVQLGLGENNFDEGVIPENIGNLKRLRWLFLGQCNFIGEIPDTIFELLSLETLDFSRNHITGSFPKFIVNLKNLYKIELYQNNLTGEIPADLPTLMELSEFDISKNQLEGKLPPEMGKLKKLKYFHIYSNNFSGELPSGFSDLEFLWSFSIYENSFTGIFPENMGKFSPLYSIDISENNFSGKFPSFLCQNGNLHFLLALDNNFSGEFPDSYSSCKTLERFRISQNRFVGSISDEIWRLPNAVIIDLADNGFVGGISSEIQFSSNLNQLYLQNNFFSGEIPVEIGDLYNLQKLDFSNNSFSGRIPIQVAKLKQLSFLNLDQNKFWGSVPSEIGSCSNLVDLNIAENFLNGNIPDSLSKLGSLNSLNLSHNALIGLIPNNLQVLKLSSIDFSNNSLSGPIPPQLLAIAGEEAFAGNPDLCISEISVTWRYSVSNISSCKWNYNRGNFFQKRVSVILLVVISLGIILTALSYVSFASYKLEKAQKHKDPEMGNGSGSIPVLESYNPPEIDPEEILNNLNESNLIGSGGTGKVYRVDLNKGRGSVAVKKMWKADNSKNLMAEISSLGKIQHKNILKLCAFIRINGVGYLIYEFMSNGNLYDALRREVKKEWIGLDWEKRYKIALGAAKGVMYLHHGCKPTIIHRDIKSSNILLDENYEARLADFGIAKKVGDVSEMSCFAGTHGYIAPELAYTLHATEKSDVYSFGVVLLELLTGQSPTDPQLDHSNLVYWATKHHLCQDLSGILDPRIFEYVQDDMRKIMEIAIRCTNESPSLRPSMLEVVNMLMDACPRVLVKDTK